MPAKKLPFRTAYSAPERVRLSFLDEDGNPQVSLVQQNFKDDCDVRKIMAKYDRTGLILHVNRGVESYGDYTEVNEYQDSLNIVIQAQTMFDELPSHIRSRFGNDPGAFLEFATNPKNAAAMVEMGLANPAPAELPKSDPLVQPDPAQPDVQPTPTA